MQEHPVPYRTIWATIGMVVLAGLALLLVYDVRRVLVWIVVALFFAVALYPVVNFLERRYPRLPRSVDTLLVFLAVFLVLAGLAAIFAVPLAREANDLAGQLPQLIADARAGRGPVGELLQRTNALEWVQQNQARISEYGRSLATPALGLAKAAATTVAAVVTIFVLAYLMVLEGPKAVDGALGLVGDERRAARVRSVGHDCAKTVTGYLSGNLLISVICGVLTYIVLKVLGVPFAGLIALFVAIVDLIPLVGATLGAVVAIAAGFVHSVTAGIVLVIFFVLYQQLENHLLQPVILSRTVKLNPLTVLVSILLAVELAGILGALLAIPVAGIIQTVARDVWDHRKGRLKQTPTVGEDRRPAGADAQQTVGLQPDAGSATDAD
ncbi:MAG TPA: AI-2E family transporter [Terrabacter sp.]|nr:AI-2E family transporter [Terrabacter sp.]